MIIPYTADCSICPRNGLCEGKADCIATGEFDITTLVDTENVVLKAEENILEEST